MSISGEAATSGGQSAVPGLPSFWDSKEVPKTDSEEWWDLFMVAANAKYSISENEILRTVTEQQQRVASLIKNMNEQAAEKNSKCSISITGVCR